MKESKKPHGQKPLASVEPGQTSKLDIPKQDDKELEGTTGMQLEEGAQESKEVSVDDKKCDAESDGSGLTKEECEKKLAEEASSEENVPSDESSEEESPEVSDEGGAKPEATDEKDSEETPSQGVSSS